MREDMDIDAGRILEGRATLDEVAQELIERVLATAAGEPTASEGLGHQEFLLTYKSFEPIGPHCLPTANRSQGTVPIFAASRTLPQEDA